MIFLGKGVDFSPKYCQLYQGDLQNNVKHGFGILACYAPKTHSFKLIYRGTFINGKLDGFGLKIYSDDGTCYSGNFYNGKRNGYGQMWYADGTFYDGDWLNGNRHGKGNITAAFHIFTFIYYNTENQK